MKIELPEEIKKQFTEYGRKGGMKLAKKKGKKYYREIALKSWESRRKKNEPSK